MKKDERNDISVKILISGALKGLGACLCKKFLNEGHEVYAGVFSTVNLMELETVSDHPNLTIVPLDVSRKESIQEARRIIDGHTKHLDVIINVAGVLLNRDSYITSDTYEDINLTFQVNTIGPIYLNNHFFDLLQKSDQATLINISSEILSIDGVGAKFGTYAMSKTAIAQYGFVLKATCVENNLPIRVFSIHPGRMKTEMGAENGEIDAHISAEGIYKIAVGQVLKENKEIYVNYKGEAMLSSI